MRLQVGAAPRPHRELKNLSEPNLSVGETEVELTLTTRDREHCDEVLATLDARGYAVERVS